MASLREVRREEAQFQVMRLVAQNPELTTRDIAKEVGISTGAAYYCLTALVEKGFVKLENFKNNPRKGQHAYVLTPRGIREKAVLTLRILERKAAEYEARDCGLGARGGARWWRGVCSACGSLAGVIGYLGSS